MKKWWIRELILMFVVLLATATTAPAAQLEPATLNYQATLTGDTGSPLTGTKTILISLYDTATAVNPFWSDSYSVPLNGGKFSVVLGSDQKPLTAVAARFNGETYIGIKVGDDPEMTPRQKMGSVAYAFNGIPRGGIIMWSGAVDAVPAGWALCNGQNGTPNLMDRFIVGAGQGYPKDSTGGVATISQDASSAPNHGHNGVVGNTTLTEAQIAPHAHVFPADDQLPGASGYRVVDWVNRFQYDAISNQGSWGGLYAITSDTGGGQPHSHGITADGGHSHSYSFDNRPPYYALAYIMKL